MSGAENALVAALIERLSEDGGLRALIGDPCRIVDAPAGSPGVLPRLLIGAGDSRPLAADGGGMEQRLTLTVESAFRGNEEARAIAAAARARLEGMELQGGGLRTVGLRVTGTETFRGADGARAYAVMRLRAMTEEV